MGVEKQDIASTRFSTSTLVLTGGFLALAAIWKFGGLWGKVIDAVIVFGGLAMVGIYSELRRRRKNRSAEDSQ